MTQNVEIGDPRRLSAVEALRLLDQANAPAAISPNAHEHNDGGGLVSRIAGELQELVLSVLKVPASEFSIGTPLLEYGLDSIAATEIGTLFAERFGITVPPTAFFEFPDILSFSRYLLENHNSRLLTRYGRDWSRSSTPVLSPPATIEPKIAAHVTAQSPLAATKSTPVVETEGSLFSIENLWAIGADGSKNNERSVDAPSFTTSSETPIKQPSSSDLQGMMRQVDEARLIIIRRPNMDDLECATFGDGPPLLLLGGLLMHFSAMWRPQLLQLGATYRLIMFHMPGCGGVPLREGLSLASLVEDVKDLLDGLGLEAPIPVLGASFGGVLAQAFCVSYPERCSALALAVTTPVAEGATNFQRLMGELQTSSSFMEVNRGWPMKSLPAYSAVIEGFNLLDKLSSLRLPTLVISGSRDRYTPSSHSRMIADVVQGAKLIEVADAGHLLPFTHHELFNEYVLEFLGALSSDAAFKPPMATSPPSAYLPTTRQTLTFAEEYVATGEQGHCVILPATSAQTAFLINHACTHQRANPASYRTYFVTSIEEALDAALRMARHIARNKHPGSATGAVLIVDQTHRWANYFDPLRRGQETALIPNVQIVSSTSRAIEAIDKDVSGNFVAVVFVAGANSLAESADQLFARIEQTDALGILVERADRSATPDLWLSVTTRLQPDIVVFGETLTDFQAPIGAVTVNTSIPNPWLMTPNEGYVRQPMAAMGFPLKIAFEHLSATIGARAELQAELRRIAATPDATFDAHIRYGNVGYARVARMHGYDGRFFEGWGMRSRFRHGPAPSREIVDCLLNVGTCPRGLNPNNIIDNVIKTHDADRDYWLELEALLRRETGLDAVLPASSQTGALESAITVGLMAAEKKKMLCFAGGAGFSMLSAASAFDPLFDLFRKPFQPIFPHVVFIDPSSTDAEQRLRAELLGGDIGFVWIETIQVEGNAVRHLPPELIRAVNELRRECGYLVGVDETQTNLWTGRFLHSVELLPSPDIVAMGTALCDSLLPAGAVLTTQSVFDKAARINPARAWELRGRSRCQLTAHLALNSLTTIIDQGLLGATSESGAYFQQALHGLALEFPLLREVRGAGLLLAIEFDLKNHSEFIRRSFGYLLWGSMLRDREGGVAVVVCPIHNNAMRIVPSLTINRREIDSIVDNLRRWLRAGVEGVVRDCATYNESLGDGRTAAFLLSQISRENEGKGVKMQANETSTATTRTIRPLKSKEGVPTVCVIGAGVGGISMAGALTKKGIPFDCFDLRDSIGGIWACDTKREHTSVWNSMNMNTPKGLYQFADFPMPADYPDYPQWHQVQRYLESYIEHHDMRSNFHLGVGVESADRLANGRWRIRLSCGETRLYDALVVANGHHNRPNYPSYANTGAFKGTEIHSRHYRDRHVYHDKKVLVVGVGNSGAQIAVDVSYDAKITYISLRRGIYIIPHYMFGFRIDKVLGPSLSWWFKKALPNSLYPRFFTVLYNIAMKHRKIGMPEPDHLMMTCLPTVSESLPNRIGDGKIKLVPDVKAIEGNNVHLADGSTIEVDSIIYSTGFQTTLPFFDKEFLEIEENKIPLYKRIFLPGVPNLAFVGMFQAIRWGFLDIMEPQANLISEYLIENYALPSKEEQLADVARERKLVEKEFMHTLRNNYYLHGDTYLHELKKELKRGKKRARSPGLAPPYVKGGDVISTPADIVSIAAQ